MTANTSPIFTQVPNISWTAIIASANTAMDGTGTVNTVITGDTDGTFVQRVVARATGSCIASVMRIFINNGSTNATAGNNALFADVSLAATTASNTAALAPVDVPLNIVLPSGYKLNVTLGTAVSAGYKFIAIGGDYS